MVENVRDRRFVEFTISETHIYSLNWFELNKKFREYLIKIRAVQNKINITLKVWFNIEAEVALEKQTSKIKDFWNNYSNCWNNLVNNRSK
jgi:hypothetical protein